MDTEMAPTHSLPHPNEALAKVMSGLLPEAVIVVPTRFGVAVTAQISSGSATDEVGNKYQFGRDCSKEIGAFTGALTKAGVKWSSTDSKEVHQYTAWQYTPCDQHDTGYYDAEHTTHHQQLVIDDSPELRRFLVQELREVDARTSAAEQRALLAREAKLRDNIDSITEV